MRQKERILARILMMANRARRTGGLVAALRPLAFLCLLAAPQPGRTESLADAIALAYQSNPTLQSQRAQLRALDETYVQARSQFGPVVQIDGTVGYSNDLLRRQRIRGVDIPDATNQSDTIGAQLTVSQTLYSGGRTTSEVRAAEYRVRAGRESLRAAEGDIVFSVIQAYVDVRRDARALEIRRQNLVAIKQQAVEIAARWRAGELTRTDVAQAEAQVAAEEASVATAENQLRAGRISYAINVGRAPGTLEPEPPLPNLPATIEQAWDIAQSSSPELLQALYNEEQSRARVQAARAAGHPTLSLRGSGGYSTELDPLNRYNRDRAVTGQIVFAQPLFSSGFTRSVTRQAEETNSSDRLQIEVARRSAIQSATTAWNQMVTLQGNIERQRRNVERSALAFRGMKIEYRAGQRSTLDVLVAEETLRDAELAELSAEHDAYLSAALVLRYIGRLDAADIVEALPRYDPSDHFQRVANKGALPWEPLVRALDRLFLPAARQRSLPAPAAAVAAQIAPAPDGVARTGVTDEVPLTPVPGTVSNVLPPLPTSPARTDGPRGQASDRHE